MSVAGPEALSSSPQQPDWRQRIALPTLVALLAVIPIALAASAASPGAVASAFDHRSPALAFATGLAALLGLALLPTLNRMGRVGAMAFAVPVAVFALTDALSTSQLLPVSTGSFELDALLQLLLPTGWFLLLFGVLRQAGWARPGSLTMLIGASILSVALFAIPSGPLPVEDMADRMVYHGLVNSGIVVAGVAVLIEGIRRRAPD